MTSHRKHETFKNECYFDVQATKGLSFTTKKPKRYLTAFKYLVREFTRNLVKPLDVALLRYTKTDGMGNPYKPVVIQDGVAYLNFYAIDNISDVGQKEKSTMHLHNKIVGMVFGVYTEITEVYDDPNVAKDYLQLVRENWATVSATAMNILRGSGKNLAKLLEKLDLEFIDNPKIAENIVVNEEIGVGNIDDDVEWDESLETEEKGDESDGESDDEEEEDEEGEVEIDWDMAWS